MKLQLAIACVVLLACIVAGKIWLDRTAPHPASNSTGDLADVTPPGTSPRPSAPSSPSTPSESSTTDAPPPDTADTKTTAKVVPAPAPALKPATPSPQPKSAAPAPAQPVNPPKPERDPLPRMALGLVGIDPKAELYWAAAINDPTRDPEERKDLIEDLNEDGFPDPKNVTPDDLPLIQNRIDLIEALGPYAMDDVNEAAFAEAYKDLLEMRNKAGR